MNEKELWEQVKTYLSADESVAADVYNYYVVDASINMVDNDNCLIVVGSDFAQQIFTDALDPKIRKIIKNLTNINYNTKYITKEQVVDEPLIKQKKFDEFAGDDEKRKEYTFENFVKGESNKQAYQAALAVTLEPSRKWNPLFIYGDSGLGKTHLLHAIKNKVNDIYGEKYQVKYLNSEAFGKMTISVISNHKHEQIEAFKDSFNEYDVLLIDDIQLLAKRNKTNEVFFHILNSFIENDKQIVITSDKYPEELRGFEQRIISRFNYGLSISLDFPDFDTALKILKQKIQSKNVKNNFSNEVLEFIALNFNSDVRKLEGAINRLLFYSILENKPDEEINIKHIDKIFKDIPIQTSEKITIKKIKQIVSDEYKISIKVLTGKSRIAEVVLARQLTMYLSRMLIDESYSKIGLEFGGKDHTTVINAIKKIENAMNENKEFKKYVNTLKKNITGK